MSFPGVSLSVYKDSRGHTWGLRADLGWVRGRSPQEVGKAEAPLTGILFNKCLVAVLR